MAYPMTLEGIRAYMTWLPGFMRGKDAARIELLLTLVDDLQAQAGKDAEELGIVEGYVFRHQEREQKLEEKIEGLESQAYDAWERSMGEDI